MVLTMTAASLFIFNFDRRTWLLMKKKVKYIVSCLLFYIIFIGCGKFFRYILVDDTISYTRITFHEMYEQENVDILFVGSSHCYRSFIPEIFDEELGLNTFNAGTSSQNLDGSFMIIKEAARYNDIKHVYLELYYNMALTAYKERTEMTQTYIISDYLRPSWDKFQYILDASVKDYYPISFIPARRNWSKFFDDEYIKNILIKKETDDYKNYKYTYITGESEWYAGKGYVANKEIVKDWNYFSTYGWGGINVRKFSDDWFCSLKEIITFCQERGIFLTLVSAPMPEYLLAGVGNYDEYVELVRSMVRESNVNYYDFNLCREKYFPNESSLFKDTDHMNCYGAEIFSHLFADFINGIISEDDLFYSTYDEKIKNLKPTVFGISYNDYIKNTGEKVRNCKIVSTGNDDLECEVIASPTGGEPYKIRDFSKNKFFDITPDEHGIITVAYRLNSSLDEIWTVDISY